MHHPFALALIVASLAVSGISARAQDANATPLQVVDANGNVLGSYSAGVAVYPSPNGLVSVPMSGGPSSGLPVRTWGDGAVWFHSTDCTGAAYLPYSSVIQSGLLVGVVTAGTLHHYLWVADIAAAPTNQNVADAHSTYSDDKCSRYSAAGFVQAYKSTTPPIDLGTTFTAPVKLR